METITLKYGIPENDWENIVRIFQQFNNINQVWLYGSRALGTSQKYSDIDISISGNNIDWATLNQLELLLDELNLPYQFDICIKDEIDNEHLLNHIERVGIEIL